MYPKISLSLFIFLLTIVVNLKAATFDFVDTPISDVARSLSLAYDTQILVDKNIEQRVTFHMENVGVLEGLLELCNSLGLQVVEEGEIFRIKPKKDRGENYFSKNDSLVSIRIRDKDVKEFIQEFASNTDLNILASPEISGKISGELRDLPAEKAFQFIMESHGYYVCKKSGYIKVDVKKENQNNDNLHSFEISQEDSLYSLSTKSANLVDVLKELSQLANLNLALYGDIQEFVRVNLSKVTLKELLNTIFMGSKYVFALDSMNLFVSECGAKGALSKMKIFPLKHILCEKAFSQISKFFTNGTLVISEFKEQNALILAGSLSEISSAESMLELMDIPSLQVTLSCILVEFKRGKNFEFGLHSGASRKTKEYNLGLRGFYDFLGKDISKSGSFGKIGILPDRFEIELANLEESNKAEVLARPKLTTLNGNKAELNVTNTVYYLVSQVSSDGYPITDYRSFNDGISLEMTPSVTKSGTITLEISPEIKTAGRSSGDGPRDISTRNLKTTVVLKNGETLCLGGLLRKNKNEVHSAIPFLGSIPIIGKLFTYISEVEDESELAIFITPEVVQGVSKNVE